MVTGKNWVKQAGWSMLLVLLTAFLTHQYDLQTVGYQQELSYQQKLFVSLLEPTHFKAEPNKFYTYNLVVLTNPTDKKIAIRQMMLYFPEGWKEEENIIEQNTTPLIKDQLPSLEEGKIDAITEVKPYMELEAGDSKPMKEEWLIKTPNKEGTYYLTICAVTFTNEKYCAKNNLIIDVVNQTQENLS